MTDTAREHLAVVVRQGVLEGGLEPDAVREIVEEVLGDAAEEQGRRDRREEILGATQPAEGAGSA